MSAADWFERPHREDAYTDSPVARERTPGERDRDRVLYSSAFQRLGGITQVVPAGTGQAVHSRLMHSLKVAQVARRLTQRLLEHDDKLSGEIDPDSVEAAALAHDLGHPPFGHIAEKVLDECARRAECDGFEGNAQSFRILTRLAQRWPATDEQWGLNLTRRTLNGTLKYPWRRDRDDPRKKKKWGAYDADSRAFDWARRGSEDDRRSLAAEIMDWSDDMTFAIHDMEDFFRAGLIPLDRLCTSSDERDRFRGSFRERGEEPEKPKDALREFDLDVLDGAVETLFGDLLDFVEPYTGNRVQRQLLRERSSHMVRDYMHAFSIADGAADVERQAEAEVAVLKHLTWFYVIDRPDLATVQAGQREIVESLFERFFEASMNETWGLFPELEQEALVDAKTESARARVVIDFIARLTEDRALELHRRLSGMTVPVLATGRH